MPAQSNPATRSYVSPDAGVSSSAPSGFVWLRIALVVALVLALAAHLYGLYTPGEPGASEWFPNSDKVLHFFGFAAPTLLAMLVVRHWWPALVFAAHAVISEIAQAMFLPGRDGDVWDVLADLTGVLAATVAWLAWRRRSVDRTRR
ncbi:MAG: VanZ family protein [Micropruina sp.]